MAKFVIQGGKKLHGEIEVGGGKNAALKIIPAALLSSDKITITNLPDIEDVGQTLNIIQDLGGNVVRKKNSCEIKTERITKSELNPEFACKLRASIVFTGPMLTRTGKVRFPHPGGDVIGAGVRPIDLFLEGFTALGAEVKILDNCYQVQAKKLRGGNYFFTTVSVTGTETLMMAATLAEGTTVLKNCALEPEIKALADYLNQQGAKIQGAGTPTIVIEGIKELRAGSFNIIPDRIETGTFAIMAAATKSNIKITKCDPLHIEILLNIFKKIGINYSSGPTWIEIFPTDKFKAYNITTHEYPGFPTDLQSPYTVLATQAQGTSIIHETIYDRRLLFTDMLTQMGADIIMCDPHRVVVNGPTKLYGRKLTSPDIRAGIAMIIAGLVAEGTTEISNIYQIDRGYEKLEQRLQKIGADIKRIPE